LPFFSSSYGQEKPTQLAIFSTYLRFFQGVLQFFLLRRKPPLICIPSPIGQSWRWRNAMSIPWDLYFLFKDPFSLSSPPLCCAMECSPPSHPAVWVFPQKGCDPVCKSFPYLKSLNFFLSFVFRFSWPSSFVVGPAQGYQLPRALLFQGSSHLRRFVFTLSQSHERETLLNAFSPFPTPLILY